jgi:hypothetical protein
MGRWQRASRIAAVLALAGTAAHADDARTLRRVHDPVVVRTDRLGDLPTRETRDVVLYRMTGDRAGPIPFQFDACDAKGDVVVDGPRDFRFDDDDELVFMAADAGDRATTPPCPAGCDAVVEIALVDPRDGSHAWAYLAHFAEAAPRPDFPPYVRFDAKAGVARSDAYEVDYAHGRNYFTGIRIGGGDRPNLIRQTRMRGSPTFSLLLLDVTLDFTEQNSIIDVEGVRVGPVRAVRRARLSIDLGSLFPDLPGGKAYTYHYRTMYLTPSRIGFSWAILKALREFRFENLVDFAPSTMPLTYYDAGHTDGIALDRLPTPEVKIDDDRDWWAHTSATGTMLHTLVIPSRWREWGITRGTMLRAGGEQTGDTPAFAAGYTLDNMTRLREAGTWDMLMASVVLPGPYHAGDEDDALAFLRAPLRIDVRRVQ